MNDVGTQELGGDYLTGMDILKLQRMYECIEGESNFKYGMNKVHLKYTLFFNYPYRLFYEKQIYWPKIHFPL